MLIGSNIISCFVVKELIAITELYDVQNAYIDNQGEAFIRKMSSTPQRGKIFRYWVSLPRWIIWLQHGSHLTTLLVGSSAVCYHEPSFLSREVALGGAENL
jgi:hypothetical protein